MAEFPTYIFYTIKRRYGFPQTSTRLKVIGFPTYKNKCNARWQAAPEKNWGGGGCIYCGGGGCGVDEKRGRVLDLLSSRVLLYGTYREGDEGVGAYLGHTKCAPYWMVILYNIYGR